MKNILLLFLSAPLWGATYGQAKTVTVYTTADRSDLRLSENGKLTFSDYRQPLETEPFILVDVSAAFQSYIGIGGALTDAAVRQSLEPSFLDERYGYSMINDFNNGCVGWTDWNILLDENGGPNHVGNFCFAPIHGDTRTGKLIYTNAYYYIGHFSKFVHPGARRIAASTNRVALQTTAFVNEDGSVVVVVMNTTDTKMPYHLCIKGKAAVVESLPHSISTLVIR